MKVFTANRLSDGAVVYIGDGETWVETLDAARVVTDAEGEAALDATAKAAVKARLVVGAYPMPVTVEDGTIRPDSVRERIRAAGPSNRTDLGKQAEMGR
ncbi:DUF2849 domain-containing protein [Zavarzinia compransoris]|uniref:DUF2849 domain-containing protein n=1 Tax=Zavarzinia marina TaxID=2911065 RepID=UPI001F1A1C1D|nr:DUF2849 domain-containing protein [Zavarzinia marina]MCF4164086.1 DUF2849 domain-containing protein [Zavarzinia marina]